jgi:hypothetical protein
MPLKRLSDVKRPDGTVSVGVHVQADTNAVGMQISGRWRSVTLR